MKVIKIIICKSFDLNRTITDYKRTLHWAGYAS